MKQRDGYITARAMFGGLLVAFIVVLLTACTSTAGIGTAPGLYQGPNLDGSAGFVVE